MRDTRKFNHRLYVEVSEEELNELSRRKLGTYVKKAAWDMAQASGTIAKDNENDPKKVARQHKAIDRYNKRITGIDRAVDRLRKEDLDHLVNILSEDELEYVTELSKETLGRYVNKASSQSTDAHKNRNMKTMKKRYTGVQNAMKSISQKNEELDTFVNSLSEDELEYVTELSKKTIGSYLNKAGASRDQNLDKLSDAMRRKKEMAGVSGNNSYKRDVNKKLKTSMKQIDKRDKGIKMGMNRLTKEEQDLSSLTEGYAKYISDVNNKSWRNSVDEAVEVSHDRYLRSHGKKARDSGFPSAWAFTHKERGDVDLKNKKEVHQVNGKFSDATKSAKKWAKENGHSTVYVLE